MSMSDANVTAVIRSLIKEATAKFWSDAEITLYKTMAMQMIWGRYSPWLYETYKKWADFGITASTEAYTISSSISSDVYKIATINVKETGRKLIYIHHDEIYRFKDDYTSDTGDPTAWTYKGKTQVALFPTPDTTDTDYLQCFYMPNYTDITTFPDSLQPLVCVQAVILAKTKDEDVTPDLINLLNWHEQAAMIDIAMSSMGKVEVFPDFMEEETMV